MEGEYRVRDIARNMEKLNENWDFHIVTTLITLELRQSGDTLMYLDCRHRDVGFLRCGQENYYSSCCLFASIVREGERELDRERERDRETERQRETEREREREREKKEI